MGLSAIIVSFVYSWKLTLLIFAFIPFLLLAGAMYTSINTSFAAKEKETLVQASAVCEFAGSHLCLSYLNLYFCFLLGRIVDQKL